MYAIYAILYFICGELSTFHLIYRIERCALIQYAFCMGVALFIKCILSLKISIPNYRLLSSWGSPLNDHLLKFAYHSLFTILPRKEQA